MVNNYIKVTLAGETKSHILMASLRDFYLSQGAKVEKPTEKEVLAVFPTEKKQEAAIEELKAIHKAELDAALEDQKRLEEILKKLRAEKKRLEKEHEELKAKQEELTRERDELLKQKTKQ